MSTMEGTIVSAEEKTSKKGKPYIRLEIDTGGNKAWWTGFCTLQPLSVGARAIFSVKRAGDSDIVDDYNIIEPGTDSAPSSHPPSHPPSQQAGKHYGSRDMWIATECIYQHWIARYQSFASAEQVAEMVKASAQMAMNVNQMFKKYESGGGIAAPTERDVQAAIAQVQGDVRNPPPSDDFDDDIPF